MSESSSSSSISSSLSAFEIDNIKSSSTLLVSKKKRNEKKNFSNVKFEEKETHIPYISSNFEKQNDSFFEEHNEKEIDLYPIFKNTKIHLHNENKSILEKEKISVENDDKNSINNDNINNDEYKKIENEIHDNKIENTQELIHNEQFDFPIDNSKVESNTQITSNKEFIKPSSPKEDSKLVNKNSNMSEMSNISTNSRVQFQHSPKEDSKLLNKSSNISEMSNISTNSRVQFQYSPKDESKLNNKSSNISDRSLNSNFRNNHSPKDQKGTIPSFSPPMNFNNTEYIQRILKPDEFKKSPDEKDVKKITNLTPIIKSQNSEYSRKSMHSNVSRHSSQNMKQSPHFSNISRHSMLSNHSKQSHHSNISKKSEASNVSRNTELSNISKNSSSTNITITVDDKERGMFIAKYYILKDLYPRMNIQIPDDTYTLDRIKSEYNELYKKVCADRFAGEYRTYIAISFAVIEVVLCKVFKLNATGFTKFHLKRINQYNESLLLLGENTASESTVRNPFSEIITAGAINTVFFILIKYLGSYLSEDTAEKVIQGILDSINTNVDNNIDIHGLNPESIGDYVDTFMKIIPDKKEKEQKQQSKKPQMKRPTYTDD